MWGELKEKKKDFKIQKLKKGVKYKQKKSLLKMNKKKRNQKTKNKRKCRMTLMILETSNLRKWAIQCFHKKTMINKSKLMTTKKLIILHQPILKFYKFF